MQFQVSFKNMEHSDALQALAEKKIQNMMAKYVTKPVSVQVVFQVDKGQHEIHCKIVGGDGFSVQSNAQTEYMYNTIDRLVSHLESQLRKKKEKLKSHRPVPENYRVNETLAVEAAKTEEDEPIDAENVILLEKARQRRHWDGAPN